MTELVTMMRVQPPLSKEAGIRDCVLGSAVTITLPRRLYITLPRCFPTEHAQSSETFAMRLIAPTGCDLAYAHAYSVSISRKSCHIHIYPLHAGVRYS